MGARLTFPVVDLSGKVAVVTGGNAGIGYETAKALSIMGAQTFIACRSEEKAMAAIQRMKEEVSVEFPGKTVEVEFLALDLSSFQSTREFVSTFKSKNLPLHILVNNAGVLQLERDVTPDGYERHYQVNHLCPFLLTLELLPCVKEAAAASGDARIVFVSSTVHTWAVWDPNNMNGETSYAQRRFYGNSKLYNIMTAFALQRRLQDVGVTVSCLHPGVVNTELFRQHESKWYYIKPVVKPLVGAMFRDVRQGAATTINCAVNPDLNTQQCVYYDNCRPAATTPIARDLSAQEQLWDMSITVVKDFLSPEILQQYGQTQQTGQSEASPEGQTGQLTAQSEVSPEDQTQQTGQSEASPEDQSAQSEGSLEAQTTEPREWEEAETVEEGDEGQSHAQEVEKETSEQ